MTEEEIRERLMLEIERRALHEKEKKELEKKLHAYAREIRNETKRWMMLGWGYKPHLNNLKIAVAHKKPVQWYRIRANPMLR